MKILNAALLGSAIVLAAAPAMILTAAPARADDYTDLLNILRAKGSLTQGEYSQLMAKHTHGSRRRGTAAPAETSIDTDAAAQARRDAIAAAASAAAADASMRKAEEMQASMENSPDIVRAMPYKPGAGVTIRVGAVDLNFSGIVNGFYTFSSADNSTTHPVAGALADGSGFDSSAVRNGLLPGAFIASASTTQDGVDLAAVFGVYPGIDSAHVGLLNANNGGESTALGTAGVDFRKTYVTAGTKTFGTIKIGRDIGIFGSDAILNDATLLSVGSPGGNADPANTSLGRIGLGYIYTDFMPQITYISPIFAGFQGTVGIFQPLNEFNFSGLSGSARAHDTPLFEGKLTYDYKGAGWDTHIWGGFMFQPQQNITTLAGFATGNNKTAAAGEVGALVDIGPVGITGYYYRGNGVGTTGKFFDGISAGGDLRDSEGGYIQAALKITPKVKLVGSYGVSELNNGVGDTDPTLLNRNSSEVGAAYYSMTSWLTLVGEYAHTRSTSHGPNEVSSDAVSAGAILFY